MAFTVPSDSWKQPRVGKLIRVSSGFLEEVVNPNMARGPVFLLSQ